MDAGQAPRRAGRARRGPCRQESIYSGLTVEEIRTGSRRAAELAGGARAARGAAAGGEGRGRRADAGGDGGAALRDPAWLFELKYDGFRVLAGARGGEPRLVYRRGSDATATYPDVARALRRCPSATSSSTARSWCSTTKAARASSACSSAPSSAARPTSSGPRWSCRRRYYAFDLLGFEGFDLRPLPLLERKRAAAARSSRGPAPCASLDHVEEQGEALLRRGERG